MYLWSWFGVGTFSLLAQLNLLGKDDIRDYRLWCYGVDKENCLCLLVYLVLMYVFYKQLQSNKDKHGYTM